MYISYHILFVIRMRAYSYIIRFRHNTFYTIIIKYTIRILYVSARSVIVLLIFFIVEFFFLNSHARDNNVRNEAALLVPSYIRIIKYNIFMYIYYCARAHTRVCMCTCVCACVRACVCAAVAKIAVARPTLGPCVGW